MLIHFKRLGKQLLIYGLGDTINKIIGILIVPLFTRYLLPADYGVAGVLVVTNTLIIGLCDLGMSNGMARFFHEEKNKKKIFSTAQVAMVLVTSVLALIGFLLAKYFSLFLFKTPDYTQVVGWSFLTVPFSIALTAPLMRLRLEEKAKIYAFFSVSRIITAVIINIILIIGLKLGLRGFILGPLINAVFYAVVITIFTWKNIGFTFNYLLFKKMFKFGFPFVLGLMSFWIMDWADRFILIRLTNVSEVGLYNLGYTMGMTVMLFVGSFQTAWTPFYLSVMKEKNAKKIYSLSMTYYSATIGFIVLALAVFSRDYFVFLTPKNFHGAYLIVPMIAFAYALRGVFSIVAVGGFIKKRPVFEVSADIIAVAVNILAMFLFIPIFGRLGAAWATVISYAVLPLTLYLLTYRLFKIKYELTRLAKILIIGLGLYFLSKFVYDAKLINLIFRLGIVMMYPLMLIGLGFFKEKEMEKINDFKKQFFKKRKAVKLFKRLIKK